MDEDDESERSSDGYNAHYYYELKEEREEGKQEKLQERKEKDREPEIERTKEEEFVPHSDLSGRPRRSTIPSLKNTCVPRV